MYAEINIEFKRLDSKMDPAFFLWINKTYKQQETPLIKQETPLIKQEIFTESEVIDKLSTMEYSPK